MMLSKFVNKRGLIGSAAVVLVLTGATVLLYPAQRTNGTDAGVEMSINALSEQLPARQVTMFRDPNCGCCGSWAEHLEAHGYEVTVTQTDTMNQFKDEQGIPPNMRSCHTALIDGLVVEGHVPVTAIEKFLTNPLPVGDKTVGLAVPGMPLGSPGMEVGRYQDFDAVAFTVDGESAVVGEYRF